MKSGKLKRTQKWNKFCEKQLRLHKEIRENARDILEAENFLKTGKFIQHGTMTVQNHCRDVARCSLQISDIMHIRCERRELIRGALLHDYFLYDWHDKKHRKITGLHGFCHPSIALENASREYELTDREKDIIKKHMWPLTIVPPVCREAWIVTTADKWCSLLETLRLHRGHGVRNFG